MRPRSSRGLIDASDYKQYIFPLVFFKRLSDVWDEDAPQALEDTGDEAMPPTTANDRFAIPDRRHWNDVRPRRATSGARCSRPFRAIEAANPERLRGVFGNAHWTDKAQMPDSTLKNLIEHFSEHDSDARRTCPRTSSATATSTSSRSSPTTAVTPRRSSTPTAPWCT